MDEQAAPLGEIFRRLIRATGPISVAQFMGEGNARYYGGKDPLGQAGDFVTAPEVSQMFGELVAAWAFSNWQAMGAPDRLAMRLDHHRHFGFGDAGGEPDRTGRHA